MKCVASLVLAIMLPLMSAASELQQHASQSQKSIPFEQLGAEAQKQYSGDGISVIPTKSGARLRAVMQDLEAEATPEGLWLTSTADTDLGKANRFRVRAMAVGRASMDAPAVLSDHGAVSVTHEAAVFVRPGLIEKYSTSTDGVRQDFVVMQTPKGNGALDVMLEVVGARAAAADYGAKLIVEATGRELAYSRLKVTDATGRELSARMRVDSPNSLHVVVEDAEATYPILIDPTFSDADWISTGDVMGTNGYVNAFATDGSGNLYVAGEFTAVVNILANRIAKWDGSVWTALGTGLNGSVNALKVSGGSLYAGGEFTQAGSVNADKVARWDGSSWSALGSGIGGTSPYLGGPSVLGLEVSGSDLYACGSFTTAGGVTANNIARWDGGAWSSLGSGTDAVVNTITMFGSELYTGGAFATAGGVSTPYIAKWNGSTWSAVGGGTNGRVFAFAVSGSTLYVGGNFSQANGVTSAYLAKWDGNNWSAFALSPFSAVYSLAVSGSNVYIGTSFGSVQKWNGSAWSALNSQWIGQVNALAFVGATLYIGGEFSVDTGSLKASYLVKWDGTTLASLGTGLSITVNTVAVLGTDLYVGGNFKYLNGIYANSVAKWNGSTWSGLGGGVTYSTPAIQTGTVSAMTVSGSNLYVGGRFTEAGGNYGYLGVAKWNGTSWSSAGSVSLVNYQLVYAIAVIGTDVYIGGDFTTAAGVTVNGIAKWNGTTMSALGTGVNGAVYALAVMGTDLYVGGSFTTVNGVAAINIAKWSNGSWSAVGAGVNSSVRALQVNGANLFAGGGVTTAGGKSAKGIARWDGTSWSALGSGISSGYVKGIAFSGTDVYVGGQFSSVGGVNANNIAKWDGSSWSALGSGVNLNTVAGEVRQMAIAGSTMYVGGGFITVGNKVSPNLAVAVNLDAPEIAVSGNSIDIVDGDSTPSVSDNTSFGNLGVTAGYISNTFTIQNAGATGLLLGAVTVSGANAADFSVSSQPATLVEAGGSTTFQISFDPSAVGVRTAVLSFTNADFDESTFNFTIQGTGTNNAPTDITLTPSSIAENNATNTTVGVLSAVDADPGDTLSLSLVSGVGSTDNASFTLSGTSLQIKVSANFEARSSYSLRVRADDGNGGLFEKVLTVSVIDIQEAPANILLSPGSIPENNAANATVGNFSASDVDAGDTQSFSLVSGAGSTDNASFTITGTSLNLMPSADFETKSSYSVRIRVTDSGGLFFEKQFTIAVTNVNEAPTDIALSASSIAENNTVNATVGALSATDADAADTRTYTLVSGIGSTDNSSFTISGASLRLAPSANFETKSSYSVRIRVTDAGALFFEKPFTITITNVNETPSNITLSSLSIAENNTASTVVAALLATDVDAGDAQTFTLVSGTGSTDNASFNIQGSSLNIGVSTDYETKSSYAIRIRTTDAGGLFFEKQFTIAVTNVNEAPIDIALSASSITESNTANATVGTLTATDVDAGDSRTYTLVPGTGSTDNASFTVTGTLLKISPQSDFEAKNSYGVRIRVTDAGALFFEEAFTITINNANETPSFIKGGDQTLPIRTSTPQTVVGWTAALDDGDSTVAQSLTFNVSVLSNGGIFAIPPAVSSDGTLTYTPAGTAGTASISVTLTDDASINGDPPLTTAAQIFTIKVAGPGDLDSLDANVVGDNVFATMVQPDGKIILAGTFSSILGVSRNNIARLNSDGTLDTSFDPNTDGSVYGAALQNDGKVLLWGSFTSLQPNGAPTPITLRYVARLNPDGTLDTAFAPNPNNYVRSVALQPDGRILLGGDFNALQPGSAASATTRNSIARVNADGTLEAGFDPSANNTVYTVKVLANGKVLLGGDFTTLQPNSAASATARRYIARLNSDGTLDTSFDPRANGSVYSMTVQADGRLLLGGAFTTLQPNGAPAPTARNCIARLNTDGTLDSGFNPSADSSVYSMVVQTDGKVVLGGAFTTLRPNGATSSTARHFIARVNADGTVDTDFDPETNGYVYGATLQADGRVLIGGDFSTLQPNAAPFPFARRLFARLENDIATQVLTVPDHTQVLWTRGGAAPEAEQVTFELSTDLGSHWVLIGGGSRVGTTSSWQCTALALPAGGSLRVRGQTPGGLYNGGSGLIEQVLQFTVAAPEIVLEQGSELMDGTGSVDFGSFPLDGSTSKQFTIRNMGTAALALTSVTVSGPQMADFAVNTSGLNRTLAPAASTTFTVTFKPAAIGSRGTTLQIASDDADENPFDITLTGSGLTTQQNWRQQYFGTSTNSGSAADDADTDNDGIANLLEWACNLSPVNASKLPVSVAHNGGNFEFTYTRSIEAMNAGAQFMVEWSDTLAAGSWSGTGVTEQVQSDNGVVQVVKVVFPAGGSSRFAHLRVTTD